LIDAPVFPENWIDFKQVISWKLGLLKQASDHFIGSARNTPTRQAFDSFCSENAAWLDDYALFMAVKEVHKNASWENWQVDLRCRDQLALKQACRKYRQAILRFKFFQFLFFRQWSALKAYANGKHVQIIGDMPMYVAHDSADVWVNPGLFFLDENQKPSFVAGVPPDYFSSTGQLWGHPLYRWEVHQQSGYQWWLDRFRQLLDKVDYIRLDHFRGFERYWEVPADQSTAKTGRWVSGPGRPFFEALRDVLGDLPILAEDLGFITKEVVELRNAFRFPGMKVLQFEFTALNETLHEAADLVVYTGTHDNDTARGWYENASRRARRQVKQVLGIKGMGQKSAEEFSWALIRAAWASSAVTAIAPMQDFLNLGSEARMNYPGRNEGNWKWRMDERALSDRLADRIHELNCLYQR
jgi:4-alpha-glucanotransferase